MVRKQIIASNDVDRQNEQMADKVLFEIAESINKNEYVMRMGLNHDISIMPVGKVIKGTVINMQDDILGLEAQIDDFMYEFYKIIGPDKQVLYTASSSLDKRPFIEYEADVKDKITVLLSPLNFVDNEYQELKNVINDECGALVEDSIKKSFVPDPEIVIQMFIGTMIYLTTEKTAHKASEKLAEVISDDVVKVYDNLKKIIVYIGKKIIAPKETTYVLTEAEQDIELVIITSNPEDVLNAIEIASDGYISSQTEKYRRYLGDTLNKIQFLYCAETKKWEVNYMLTNTGQVIGSERNYRKAVKLYNSIIKTPGAGFSIGGTATVEKNEMDNVE